MLSVLTRNGDFRRLFFAQLITFGADWFIMVPLLVLLNELTGKGIWGGLVLAVDTGMVALLLPYAGTIADRFDRRLIMVVTSLTMMVAIGGLFAVRGPEAGPIAVAAVAAVGLAKAFYLPASSAALPNLVSAEDLPSAMVVAGTSWGTMTIVGSSLGGVLSAWISPYFCFGLVAVGLLGAAILTWRIKQPTQESVPTVPRPASGAIREAMGYLRRHPRLLALVTVKSAVGLGNGVLTVFPIMAVAFAPDKETAALYLGSMFAVRGVGALVGPLLFRRVLTHPTWLLPGLALSMSAYGLAYIGVAFATWFPLVLLGIFIAHLAGGGNWTMSAYAITLVVPDDLRGRINATDTMVAMLAVTTSQLIVGLFVDSVSPQILIAGSAVMTLSYAIGWRLVTRKLPEESLATVG